MGGGIGGVGPKNHYHGLTASDANEEGGTESNEREIYASTLHLQSKTKIAETPVFCFIGSVNKHINFYDISGGLLKGKRAIPQDTASSSRSIWFAESGGRAHCVSVSTEKGDFVGNFKLKAEFSPF